MSHHRPGVVVSTVVALALLTAACGGETAPSATPGETAPRSTATSPPAVTAGTEPVAPEPAPIEWQPCDDGLECGTVAVPVDYADPTGPTIDLAVARRPASNPHDRLGALLVNPGGPGASGIDYLRKTFIPRSGIPRSAPSGSGLADRFDLVSWDPRGVGGSAPLECGGASVDTLRAADANPDDGAEQQALDAAARAVAAECGTSDTSLLPHLGTHEVVRDLDQIRRALGEEQISYLGLSYGTLIGLEYLRSFPEHLRALAIDGVVNPADDLETLLADQTATIDRAVTEMFDACEQDTSCPVEDPAGAYDRIATRVEASPLPSSAGEAVTPTRLAIAAISATYSPQGADRLLQALAEADQGDGTALAHLADSYLSSVAAFTTYVGVVCIDGPHPLGPRAWQAFATRLAGLSPRFGAAIANEVIPCAFWPAGPSRTPSAAVNAGGPPVLVVGPTGDAATPYHDAQAVTGQLGDAVLLTLDGNGHTAFGQSPCIADAVRTYLVGLGLPDPGTVCT